MPTCNKCRREIAWIKTAKGWIPHEAAGDHAGEVHWEYCKRPAKAGAALVRTGKTVAGERYFDIKCACLPWEPCETCQRTTETVGWAG